MLDAGHVNQTNLAAPGPLLEAEEALRPVPALLWHHLGLMDQESFGNGQLLAEGGYGAVHMTCYLGSPRWQHEEEAGNILLVEALTEPGIVPEIKVADFGLARLGGPWDAATANAKKLRCK
ncbi:hypothetical protein WJX84_005786 [Apatococcus fuscideae]|uniref:Uncharacterized protein n=1 Tax=Apatococcus fuscideae TaxID=2026836 RepID=A0AAW1RG72_9CHLO